MHKLMISAVLYAALGAGAAHAEQRNTYLVTIPAAGLDLTTEAGVAALTDRAKGAARKLCGRVTPGSMSSVRECRSDFMSLARTKIEIAAATSRIELASR